MRRAPPARTVGRCAGFSQPAGGGARAGRRPGAALPRELLDEPATAIHLDEAARLSPEAGPQATLYHVRSGVVASEQGPPQAAGKVAEFYYPGDVILPPRAAGPGLCLRAVSPATLEAWNLAERRDSREGSDRLSYRLFELARDDLSRRLARSGSLCRQGVEARFATFLLEAALRLGTSARGRLVMDLPMSRGDIAGYLGLRTETVCRIIRRWRDARLIALDGPRHVEILDLEAVRALVEAPVA